MGNWVILYGDISIVHADGTVTTIYDRATSESFSYFTGGGETNPQAWIEHTTTSGSHPEATTTYYLADQIHSTRMTLAYGGWPLSQDTFYPFGVEPTPPADPNHYKFSGKNRDPASGLDNFGARYYSAVMGRFMTPDFSDVPQALPYADISDPQSFNRYVFVNGNPLSWVDLDGHDPYATNNGAPCGGQSDGVQTGREGEIIPVVKPCPNSKPETLPDGTKIWGSFYMKMHYMEMHASSPPLGGSAGGMGGSYVSAAPPRWFLNYGRDDKRSAARLRCDAGALDKGLFHGFATAVSNVKGQVSVGLLAVKRFSPFIGSATAGVVSAFGASAETAAVVGTAASGTAELAGVGAAIWIAGTGVYETYKYMNNDHECDNVQ